jgi:hypothetical protein
MMGAVAFVAIVAAQVCWMFPPGKPFSYAHGEPQFLSTREAYFFYSQILAMSAISTAVQVFFIFQGLRRIKKFSVGNRAKLFIISEVIAVLLILACLELFRLMKIRF